MNGGDVSVIGLCVVLAGCLTYICKALLAVIVNHLTHIQKTLDGLSCTDHERRLNSLEKDK